MGKRGQRPTPTAILKLRGSWLGKAREKDGEVLPCPGIPRPPVDLSERAKVFYKRACRQLATVPGLLSRVDGNALGRYADLLARYWEASEKVAKYGEVMAVKDKEGNVVGMEQSAYSVLTLRITEKLLKLEIEFGMTPAARSRLRLGDSMAAAARASAATQSTTAIVKSKADFLA